MTQESKNKWVVVTGCSSGIGKCCAELLCASGYRVIATVRKEEDKAKVKVNSRSLVLVLDLDDENSVKETAEHIIKLTGDDLFALFNNAAYGQPGAVEDLSRDALRKQFESNVFGTHQLTCELIPELLKRDDARIIQCSSILGFIGMPMRGAYVASKYALEGLTDTLRMELHDTSIKVSLIEPGPIESAFRKNALMALEANVDFKKSRHGWRYEAALARLQKEGAVSSYTLGPQAVFNKLIHALESPKPKRRYLVTRPTYIMAFLKRFASSGLIDKLLLKYAQKE